MTILSYAYKLVEGDVLTHLNGSNARLLNFSDILKACRGPERGGLPRPLVMKFSRSDELWYIVRLCTGTTGGGGGDGASQNSHVLL